MGQRLRLEAEFYTENDENTLPTGVIAPVEGTPFDFTTEKSLDRDIDREHRQLRFCRGYDHNFVLNNGGAVREFAHLESLVTGISMTAATDLPGVQLYTGNFVEEPREKGGGSIRLEVVYAWRRSSFPMPWHWNTSQNPF